jgi:hypothetical protein
LGQTAGAEGSTCAHAGATAAIAPAARAMIEQVKARDTAGIVATV